MKSRQCSVVGTLILVAPDATRAYASLQSSSGGWIVVVDTATNSQVAQISVGSEPRGLPRIASLQIAAGDGMTLYAGIDGGGRRLQDH